MTKKIMKHYRCPNCFHRAPGNKERKQVLNAVYLSRVFNGKKSWFIIGHYCLRCNTFFYGKIIDGAKPILKNNNDILKHNEVKVEKKKSSMGRIKFPKCKFCHTDIPDVKHSNRRICKKCEHERKNEATKQWMRRKAIERKGLVN